MAKEKKDTLKKADASAKEETKKAKKTEKKSKKDEGKKPNRVIKWFRDLRIEFKNVTWPTRKTVTVNATIVLTTILFSSLVVFLLDLGLMTLINFLLGLSS